MRPESEVLILGDSFLRIYEQDEPGAAGFIAHLARELGQPLTSIVNDGGGSTLVRQAAGTPPDAPDEQEAGDLGIRRARYSFRDGGVADRSPRPVEPTAPRSPSDDPRGLEIAATGTSPSAGSWPCRTGGADVAWLATEGPLKTAKTCNQSAGCLAVCIVQSFMLLIIALIASASDGCTFPAPSQALPVPSI